MFHPGSGHVALDELPAGGRRGWGWFCGSDLAACRRFNIGMLLTHGLTVDLPIPNGVIFHSYVNLPEGTDLYVMMTF